MPTEIFQDSDDASDAPAEISIVDTPVVTWDRWQRDLLAHQGSLVARTGRQVGKSQALSRKIYEFMTENPGVVLLVIAPALRQTSFIYDKIFAWFEQENARRLNEAIGDKRLKETETARISEKTSLFDGIPTRTKIVLKNGSRLYCYPAGRTGIFVMGMTIDVLIADEAAFIPEVVWNNVLPMLAVSRKTRGFGWIWMASIPFWKGGYFYDCTHDSDFREFHVSSEDCPRITRSFLDKEKKRLSKVEYARIYKGEFADEWNQYFPTALIVRASTFMEWSSERNIKSDRRYYLGVDIARMGGDENAFVVAEVDSKDNVKIVKANTTSMISLTDTIGRIIDLNKMFNFSRIFIDDAGAGGGPTDVLIEKLGRKVVGLNNASRSVTKDGAKRRILKEDLYSNALVLLENQKLEMIDNVHLHHSLKSMVYEYTTEDKRLLIHGKDSHLAEAFVRACWAIRDKGLKVYIA